MELLLKKTFKDLIDMVEVVADRFFLAKRAFEINNKDYFAELDMPSQEYYQVYLNKVSQAFASLSARERNLINNEFFYQGYNNWWESIYSKATFYRYKRKAMMKFLEAFYHD